MTQTTKAHLALIGTNIFFAINFTAVKFLFNGGFIKPFGLNFARILVTTILLWVIYIFKKNKHILDKKDLGRLVLCSLTGIVINQLLFIKGLSMIIAAIILKERVTTNKAMGLMLGVIGALVLITKRQNSGSGTNIFWGDVMVILNAISYSFYFIMVKPLMKKYEAIAVIRILFTMGLFIALPFCWNEFSMIPWYSYSIKEVGVLSLIIIGGTFCAYLFNVYGIKHLGATVSGAYIYSQPFFATVIAIVFLGETLEGYKIFAAALIFMGVYLSNKNTSNV